MTTITVSVAAYQNEPAPKSAAKVLVSKDNLLQLTGALENGRLCIVESSAGVNREALLWAAPDSLKKTLVRVSKALLELLGMRVGDKCTISVPSGTPTVSAASEILLEDTASTPRNISWYHALADPLDLVEYVFPGMVLKDVYHRRERRSFRVLEVDGRADNIARFVMDKTNVILSETSSTTSEPEERPSTPQQPSTPRTPKPTLTATLPFRSAAAASTASPTASPSRTLKSRLAAQPASAPGSPAPKPAANTPRPPPTSIEIDQIDGLETVVDVLNEFLDRFCPDSKSHGFGLSCGAAIQGDKGTGKTMLLERVTKTGWGKVFPIRPFDKLAVIQETLQNAYAERPSIVTIEDIHELLFEDRANRASVIQAIAAFLDANVGPRSGNESEEISTELVSAEQPALQVPQIIVLATCLDYLKDIPESLRQPGRLDWPVQLPFPDPSGRRAILRSFGLPFPPDKVDAMILALSHQTHAFSGTDLKRLCHTAVALRGARLRRRAKAAKTVKETNGDTVVDEQQEEYLTEADFKEARIRVGPSRMDGVDVKPRPVYWRDIHGQEELVRAFKQRVDMMNRPEMYTRWINPFPRGFLLYGPPGCSKTMAAQALATESELNYFSVKGGELLNQYVGETERGIRELFAKARRASPAVIFLDEIDALGGRRADFGDGSASSGRGPQMVPALLTELDGFEPLDKVLIVAATNRPEALDPALIRTGRIDKHFYVPPPDESARRAIFESWTKGMDVSPDLDLDVLARESDQLSGADIMGVCRKAGESVCDEETDDDVPKQLMTRHFLAAIKRAPRTISPQMLQHFQNWSASHR
ncbi:aaa family atpase [Ophiostoma piceae UAMH 11346]|uniref:Aaa family atpase n=1 Tax=Ophiostoma piceae (strain UAMH 11346) TaxID=1262450 RepID=S3BQ91_OPHP1|nr:aaa family atpase [Ophiostoma piceae UAMH 11346]